MISHEAYDSESLPITRNVPLREMDGLFSKGLGPWTANKIVMADIQVVHGLDVSIDLTLRPVS